MRDPFLKDNQMFKEETIKTEQIFQGKMISLHKETVTLPNGNVAEREIVRHPGAVAVLAIQEDKMAVVEQYRKALERSLIEIPAGKLDPGEMPEHAAARELEEETGLRSEQFKELCSFYTSPGFADEMIHLYFTNQLVQGNTNPDEDEFLNVRWLTLEEAKMNITAGKIRDAKTITAIYIWENYKLTGKF